MALESFPDPKEPYAESRPLYRGELALAAGEVSPRHYAAHAAAMPAPRRHLGELDICQPIELIRRTRDAGSQVRRRKRLGVAQRSQIGPLLDPPGCLAPPKAGGDSGTPKDYPVRSQLVAVSP